MAAAARTIAWIVHPSNGAPGAINTCTVAVTRIGRVAFKLLDKQKKRVGSAVIVGVTKGEASFTFKNPPADGGYYVVAEDNARAVNAVASVAFTVVAGTAPLPLPTPAPAPVPVPPPPTPAVMLVIPDAQAVVGKAVRVAVQAPGFTSVEWVAVAGVAPWAWRSVPLTAQADNQGRAAFVWTPSAVGEFVKVMAGSRAVSKDSPAAAAAPAPAPTPAPTPPGPAIVSITGDMANAKVGQIVRLTIKTASLPSVDWVAVRGDAAATWRTQPATLAVPASGEVALDFTPAAGGEFVKVMASGNPGIFKNSVAVPGAAPAPVPASADGDAAFAFAWRAALKHGVNIERGRAIEFAFQGKRYRDDPAFARHLLGAGINYVRLFYPWDARTDMLGDGVTMAAGRRPPIEKIRQFVQVAVQCARAGVKCWIDMTDVAALDIVQDNRALVLDHFRDFCTAVREQPELSPDMFMIGDYNEPVTWNGQGTNAHWNPIRMEDHRLIRSMLPQHLIAQAGADWCNMNAMTANDWQAPPDKRAIASFHHYQAGDRGQTYWRGVQADMDAFERRHGIPIIAGEGGDDAGHAKPENAGRWANMVRDIATAAPRTKQAWWCVTNVGWGWSLIGDDGKLLPEMERAFRETAGLWAT